MQVTRKIVADKLRDYLTHSLSLQELTDWAENAMMEAEFEQGHIETLSDIIGRLGLVDVHTFGLTWDECEAMLSRLGYHAQVRVTPA